MKFTEHQIATIMDALEIAHIHYIKRLRALPEVPDPTAEHLYYEGRIKDIEVIIRRVERSEY